jgi:DNA repair protein RecO (recombination protein O)
VDFTDSALVLSARRHGEGDLILSCLTAQHGRHLGLVRGGASRRQRAAFEAGNALAVTWRARLEEQLGHFTAEVTGSHAARLMHDPGRLAALGAATAVVDATLPERQPNAEVFEDLSTLIASLVGDGDGGDSGNAGSAGWAALYLRWELKLLADLGFGLDLGSCAVTGVTEGLEFVSPRTGRAVSRAGAGRYAERLLPLPAALRDPMAAASPGEVAQGLRVTGHFLNAHLLEGPGPGKRLQARDRLLERVNPASSGGPT